MEKSRKERETLEEEIAKQQELLNETKETYEKLRKLLEQKPYSRRRRSKSNTTYEMINDYNLSTRYRRRKETKNILGGFEPSLYGAWDFFTANASEEMMKKFMSSYKRGKFLQGIFSKAMTDYQKSEKAIKQSVAHKYQSFLSRRKYNLIAKPRVHSLTLRKKCGFPVILNAWELTLGCQKLCCQMKRLTSL